MTWAHKGDKVRFLARGGYDSELNRAKSIIKPGAVLTVTAVDVGNSSSNYAFEEVVGRWNTVMFEIVPEIEAKPLEWIDILDGVEFRAESEFGEYRYFKSGWSICELDGSGVVTSSAQPRYDAQQDYDRRVKEAHIKAQAAKNGLGHNDIWVTLCEIMGDKTPFLPEWAMMELNKRVNDKYFGGSLPDDSKAELERLQERLSIDPQGGDWIDVLESQIEGLKRDCKESDDALQELIEQAYDGNGEKFVAKTYPSTISDIVFQRRNKAIKPGLYAVNMKNGISFNGTIYMDAEGRNWIANPIFSQPFLYKAEDISSIHSLDERITPA